MSNAKKFDTLVACLAALVAAPIFARIGGLDWNIGVAISLWLIVPTLGGRK